MYLKNLTKIIYPSDTPIKIIHLGLNKILWEGKAKDLQYWDKIDGWIVVEVLVDHDSDPHDRLPDYNKGKIIKVM